MQAVLEIKALPQSSLEASAVFHHEFTAKARALLEAPETTALAITLPKAGHDHDDWRRTLARDLARAYTPKRVNVVGGEGEEAISPLIDYLEDAPGVTGQYLAAHE